MESTIFSDRKEDYAFYATILVNQEEIETELLCKVYLPVRLMDPLEVRFSLTKDQAIKLSDYLLWEYTVKGNVNLFDQPDVQIEAKVIATQGVQTKSWASGVVESSMVGYPVDLTVRRIHKAEGEKARPLEVSFWVTPNGLLEPTLVIESSYTGDVKVKPVRHFEIKNERGATFRFEKHFHHRKNEEGESVSFSELVANVTLNESANSADVQELLHSLDGILLLASFAARQRAVCLGWTAVESHSHVKQYLRNRAMPQMVDRSLRNELISRLHFSQFMNIAYETFSKISPQDPLRRALSLTLPFGDDTVEGEFVSLYTALEMLVLQFRRAHDLELIFPNNEWKKLRKKLKEYIDTVGLSPLNESKRPLIREKLSELNRVSFGTAFEGFCKHYAVNLDDLWPVVGGSGTSLSVVRNKLVHGEHFGPDHYEALSFAAMHLRWTVERMLLGILNWSVENSAVSPLMLTSWNAYREWQSTQPNL